MVEVDVEAVAGANREGLAIAAEAHIRDIVGLRVEVLVLEPGTLSRSDGKARRVVDRRTSA